MHRAPPPSVKRYILSRVKRMIRAARQDVGKKKRKKKGGRKVEEGEVHQSSIFWRMFSSRGPIIPKFTWVPSYEKKGQVVPAQIGITHPVGTKAIERLKDFEIEIPQGWILHQDHPKRGMVISLPEGCSQDQVVSFAVRTLEILSPFDFDGNYVASVTT